MDLQDSFFLPPSTCFKLKAYGNNWLALDGLRNINLSKQQDESCTFFLLPCRDARYILQLIPTRPLDVLEPLAELYAQGYIQFDDLREENVLGSCSESRDAGSWCFCKQGQFIGIAQYTPESNEEFCFSLEFDDHGGVALSSGVVNKGYWTLDSSGHLLFGAQIIGKRETFQLHEFGWSRKTLSSSWTSVAPVRVNLRAHTGQYLCSAATVISAVAEAPCCCEEFLLDVNFPPLPFPWRPSESTISGQDTQPAKKISDSFESSHCRVRTANGMFDWSAGADGKLITVQLKEAQAREQFTMSVLSHKRHSLVSVSHRFCEDGADCACYLSVDPSSRVTCNKRERGKWEEFVLELVNESRVLIRSVHGYFMGSQEASMFVKTHSSSTYSQNSEASVAVWRLRAHGESRYTLLAATSKKDQGDFYLYVDGRGVLMQSNEPTVHFPSSSSLFEIKPIASSSIWATEGSSQKSNARASLVGFTIKTIRKINGKERYLSAEPNGILRANAFHVSLWEVFQLIDVDGTASAVLPHEFSCCPASLHFVSPKIRTASLSAFEERASLGTSYAAWLLNQGSMGGLSENTNHLLGKPIESLESLKKASQVAAMATMIGRCLPERRPASLQELCINQLCLQASAEVTRLCDKFQESDAVAWVTERLVERCLSVPDDLSARILTCWRSRQHPENSCKSLPSLFSAQRDYYFQGNRNIRGPSYTREHSFWESNDDGFYCHSCNQKGLLKMNPNVNPAHHRYLEVQYQAQNGAAQSHGFLWNLISFAGVSIMSTALLVHFFADHKKKRTSSASIR